MEIVAWMSCILLALCAVPQAIHSLKEGHADGISLVFLWAWFLGEILGAVYVIYLGNIPLIFNYLANLAALCIIVWFKHFPRE